MTDVAVIENLVPGLRRYARASVGEQRMADGCVARALEDSLESVLAAANDADRRVVLYRAVYRALRAVEGETPPSPQASDAAVLGERVRHLDETPKHALLLSVLERLDLDEIAAVMDLPAATVEHCVESAFAALRAQPRARVLILEDDDLIADDIAAIVTGLGHDVAGIAATAEEALAAARRHSLDLVLADVELRGRASGIDAVRAIRERNDVRAIFVTGFPERVLSGASDEPVFVLSKPFDERLLQVTMAQALRRGTAPASA